MTSWRRSSPEAAPRRPSSTNVGTSLGWTPPVTGAQFALCPDLLRYEQIGEADNMRGRVVRAFFWLMRAWPT